jgi:trehalose 6-phosphate phosphatase
MRSDPPPPLTDLHALFLDFDGTLVEIAPRPDAVAVDARLLPVLQAVASRLHGALAILSGRPITEIDRWLSPLVLPAAGVHGAQRRTLGGIQALAPDAELEQVAERAEALAAAHPGLIVERKGVSVALHYRLAPECEAMCRSTMIEALGRASSLRLLQGKMVLEAMPKAVSKGAAIEAFLAEPPFAGRRPVFVGDDVTDEAGFEVVQRLGGIAVKVGPGDSIAQLRIDSAEGVRRWLADAALAMNGPENDPSHDNKQKDRLHDAPFT